MTDGALTQAILRTMRYESLPLRRIQERIGNHSSAAVEHALGKLKERGLVAFKWRMYSLTKQGRNALHDIAVPLARLHGTYRPERVVRRIGTDIHKRLPSRVGDQLHYREQAQEAGR